MNSRTIFFVAWLTLPGFSMDKIILNYSDEIITLNLDGTNAAVIASGFNFIGALAFEPNSRQVFWSNVDNNTDSSIIWRASLGGNQLTPLISGLAGAVMGLDFDPSGKVLFFSTMS